MRNSQLETGASENWKPWAGKRSRLGDQPPHYSGGRSTLSLGGKDGCESVEGRVLKLRKHVRNARAVCMERGKKGLKVRGVPARPMHGVQLGISSPSPSGRCRGVGNAIHADSPATKRRSRKHSTVQLTAIAVPARLVGKHCLCVRAKGRVPPGGTGWRS